MTIDSCAALVERGDPDRFMATMAAPAAARASLWPLYAFNIEVSRAPWASSEPMIAEMRLQFWRDVVADAALGTTRAHEVATPLAALIQRAQLPVATLDAMVAARRWDIYRDAHADGAALDGYLEDTGAGLMWLAAKSLGAPEQAEQAVRAVGWAAALASYLRASPELAARGRIPLLDGRPDAVAALAREGLAKLSFARRYRAHIPSGAAPALLAGWQSQGLLTQAANAPTRVVDGTLGLSEFHRRSSLIWQAISHRF